MTGSVVVLGGPKKGIVEFDTDKPESIEQCEAIWDATVKQRGAQAFDTTEEEARPIDGGFDPKVSETTIVPKFAGG